MYPAETVIPDRHRAEIEAAARAVHPYEWAAAETLHAWRKRPGIRAMRRFSRALRSLAYTIAL